MAKSKGQEVEPVAVSAQNHRIFRTQLGLSLTEYALAIALVIFIAISGLTILGFELDKKLAFLTAEIGGILNNGQSGNTNPITTVVSTQVPTPPMSISTSKANSEKICFSSRCIQVPAYLSQQSQSLVIGANGLEDRARMQQIADLLQQMATALKDDPQADPEIARLLTALAKAGHANASAQAALQFRNLLKIPPSGDWDFYYALALEGLPPDLAKGATDFYMPDPRELDAIKLKVASIDFANSRDQFAAYSNLLKPYLSQLQADKSDLIVNSSEVIKSLMAFFGKQQAANVSGEILYIRREKVAGETIQLTHSESNTICKNGGIPPQCIR